MRSSMADADERKMTRDRLHLPSTDQIQRANKARPTREEENHEHDVQREVDIIIVHMSGMLQHA